jgi:hypothetical protein
MPQFDETTTPFSGKDVVVSSRNNVYISLRATKTFNHEGYSTYPSVHLLPETALPCVTRLLPRILPFQRDDKKRTHPSKATTLKHA